MQYENKTHEFYKIKGKEEILKAFIEKQTFFTKEQEANNF